MTLAELLLEKLSSWRPTADGRHSMTESFAEQGWTVTLAADRTDTIGTVAWELSLLRNAEPPAGLTLPTWANQIADRNSGLLEDLKVFEVDATLNEAILRSDSPAVRGDDRFYYEVRLSGLSLATVRRYKANRSAGTRREQTGFTLTHESLAKLAGDIAA